ncbi:MAG TPA: electron transfer flavoprotein subunit alpha, partial [Exiguobacterium sp.]|nr:electron transfer flavoprotein subunit alpha [Exiguobacterium sp.]
MTKALVLAESRDGSLRNVSFEAIAAARRVADEVIAVLIGHDVAKDADVLASRGADQVLVVEDERLLHYTPDGYGQVFLELMNRTSPDVLVFGHTSLGKDLSPKIAAKLQAGL